MKDLVPEYLSGALSEENRTRLLTHLDGCAACREEVARLDQVWRKLDLLPAAEPSHLLRPRFEEMLAAFEYGSSQSRAEPSPRRHWFTIPVWAAAASAVLLMAAGIAAGTALSRYSRPQPTEFAQLNTELDQMRQLVTLSLLEQQSPGARLRGVNYSYRLKRQDPQVEAALLYAVSHDTNVNVRLSAIDALQKFTGSPQITKALIEALPSQDSPLVQIGLIDMLVSRNESDVTPVLRKLMKDAQIHPAVRQRAQWGLNQLGAA